MSILKKYNRHLIRRGFNGPLDIHLPFKLGHIITFDKQSGFEVMGHISDPHFNLQDFIAKEVTGPALADIDFGSETGVNVDIKLKGDAVIPESRLSIDDAGLVVEFQSEASYLLKTGDTKVHLIENIAELGEKVNNLYLTKRWNRNWFVITQLIEAQRTTLLISKSANSKIEFKALAKVDSLSEDDLVSAEVNLSVMTKKSMSTYIIGKEGPYYPLFKANGIKVKRLIPSPIGTSFESYYKVNPMNAYTIADLESENSHFKIVFEENHFEDEVLDNDSAYLT